MTRKNIFEILKEKYNVKKEISKIITLFEEMKIQRTNPLDFQMETYSIEHLCNHFCFYTWKQRGAYLNCEEMRADLQLKTENISREDDVIIILEYYINILSLINARCRLRDSTKFLVPQLFWMMNKNIDILLEHLNYKEIINSEEEKVILVPKNPAATAVAEITENKDIAFAILKYNHASLKGDLEGKRQLLLSIANEYEPLLKKPIDGFKDYFSMATGLLNNIHLRHNNKTGKDKKEVVANMSDKELEKWYDELYQLLLFCILIKDNTKRKDEMAELLKKLKKR